MPIQSQGITRDNVSVDVSAAAYFRVVGAVLEVLAAVSTLRGHLVGEQPGVVGVPDLFAIVVGPSSLIVDADVVFDDGLDVPRVEAIIVGAAAALRSRWPTIAYVYLNPVAEHRRRRYIPVDPTDRRSRTPIGGHQVPVTTDRDSQSAAGQRRPPSEQGSSALQQGSFASSAKRSAAGS